MTLDAHQHFWVYTPERDTWITDEMTVLQRDFLPADLEPLLRANGVDGCVAVQASQSDDETAFLLGLAQAYEFIRGVVGWVDLRAANLYERLEVYSQFEELKGFRHVAQAEPADFLMRPDLLKGIKQLAAFDFTYDILIYPTQLKAALHLVRSVPDVTFVLDHIAKPHIKNKEINRWSNFIAEIAKQPNVSCKLSGLVTEADWQSWSKADLFPYLDVVFEHFGPDRLLFGSDWPVCLVAAEYDRWKTVVETYLEPWGAEARTRVMGRNAEVFYKL